ncbi:MAG: hypothetical protein N3D20_00915 [Candidatus Pacearchaeota archaeon]|nr:hypothetical protein [Candidatus Pacearchaeota archaeon]
MGGKTLKFPKRKKFVREQKEGEVKETLITEEEHKKRVDLLKSLGLLKETNDKNKSNEIEKARE